MNPPASPDPRHGPLIEPDPDASYTLDVVARVCGVSSRTILHYHEQGLLRPVAEDDAGGGCFDDETVRRLRRIEHLRQTYGMDTAALRLTLGLMDELDRLRSELRLRG
jgi:DNA-binding transcriptional MerR regulator